MSCPRAHLDQVPLQGLQVREPGADASAAGGKFTEARAEKCRSGLRGLDSKTEGMQRPTACRAQTSGSGIASLFQGPVSQLAPTTLAIGARCSLTVAT